MRAKFAKSIAERVEGVRKSEVVLLQSREPVTEIKARTKGSNKANRADISTFRGSMQAYTEEIKESYIDAANGLEQELYGRLMQQERGQIPTTCSRSRCRFQVSRIRNKPSKFHN